MVMIIHNTLENINVKEGKVVMVVPVWYQEDSSEFEKWKILARYKEQKHKLNKLT